MGILTTRPAGGSRLPLAQWFMLGCLLLFSAQAAEADEPAARQAHRKWHTDYAAAVRSAKEQDKLLLIHFVSARSRRMCEAVGNRISSDPKLADHLEHYVLAWLPVDTEIQVGGEPLRLIEHGSMGEMHGFAGLAIIDYMHQDEAYYGHVVSAFPYMRSKYYQFRIEHLPAMLTLPPGTITQRSMIWAVRVHPERPASTRGQSSEVLARAAREHSEYQARLGVQGHHRWNRRFQFLRRLLGFRRTPTEVVAESWPHQTMIDSCIDCVASWRHSSGHWRAVRSYQPEYGYDIKLGANGVWYGTGIFAR